MATAIPVNYRDNTLAIAFRVLGAIALIGGSESIALGGRGEFPLGSRWPSRGPARWSSMKLSPR